MPIRIAILGGPRCGKTTLIQQVYVDLKVQGYDVAAASEYSTEYLKEKGMIETISEQYGIYLGQKILSVIRPLIELARTYLNSMVSLLRMVVSQQLT